MTFIDPASEIVTFLAASGLGLTAGTNIFYTRLPDQPDAAVGVTCTGGIAPLTNMLGQSAADVKVDQPTFQIRVRGAPETYATASALAYAIFAKLQPVTEQTLVGGGQTWSCIEALQSPTDLGLDSKQRPEIVQNFRSQIQTANR